MVFKRKGFFLTFDENAAKKPAAVAPVVVAPAPEAPLKSSPETKATAPQPAAPAAESGAKALTTAEAIAAELREAQANRPAPSLATFAPANLSPGGALPIRRRRGGANLAPYRAIAAGLFRS